MRERGTKLRCAKAETAAKANRDPKKGKSKCIWRLWRTGRSQVEIIKVEREAIVQLERTPKTMNYLFMLILGKLHTPERQLQGLVCVIGTKHG